MEHQSTRAQSKPGTHLSVVRDAPVKPRESYKERFRNTFGQRVSAAAKQDNWTCEAKRLAHAYLTALLTGDGEVPDGLRNRVIIEAIRREFIATCAKMRPSYMSFPGQSQEWFTPRTKWSAHPKQASKKPPVMSVPTAS